MNRTAAMLYEWCENVPVAGKVLLRVRSSPIGARLAHGVFWSMFAAIGSRAIGLVGAISVARILGQTKFGELGMVQSTATTVSTFAGLGMGLAATRYVGNLRRRDPARVGRILGLVTFASVLTGAIAAGLLYTSATWVAEHLLSAPRLSVGLRVASAGVLFGIVNGTQIGALAGFEAFRPTAKINLASAIIGIPTAIVGAFFFGVNGALAAYVANLSIACILNMRALQGACIANGISIAFRGIWLERETLWRFTLPITLSSLMTAPVTWYGNLVLVKSPSGYASLGLLNAAQQWQTVILFVPTTIAGAVLGLLANVHGERDKRTYWKTVRVSIAVTATSASAIALLVALLAPYLMKLYGRSFDYNSAILVALAAAAVLMAIGSSVGQIITSSGSMWTSFIVNAIWAAAFLLLVGPLVASSGVMGMATTYLLSYVVLVLISLSYVFIRVKNES